MTVKWDEHSNAYQIWHDGKIWPTYLTDAEVIEDVAHHTKWATIYPISLPMILEEAKKRGLV